MTTHLALVCLHIVTDISIARRHGRQRLATLGVALSMSLCDGFAVATSSADEIHTAITFFAVRREELAVHLFAMAHQRPDRPPYLPGEALPPAFWSTSSTRCHSQSGLACCTASLVDPSSPGQHVVLSVRACDGASAESLVLINATFALRPRGHGGRRETRHLSVSARLCAPPPPPPRAFASVCLGPVFDGSSGASDGSRAAHLSRQRQRVWETEEPRKTLFLRETHPLVVELNTDPSRRGETRYES